MKIESYVKGLLHVNEPKTNKLLNLFAKGDAYYLTSAVETGLGTACDLITIAKREMGKPANTVLRGSDLGGSQRIKLDANVFDWADENGDNKCATKLDKFVGVSHDEIRKKGINPLFLGLGIVSWQIPMGLKGDIETIKSPLIILPIKLIRGGGASPVYIEFVDDDVYFNPCFMAKFQELYPESIANKFPHPNGMVTDYDTPIDFELLQSGKDYFDKVSEFIAAHADNSNSSAVFEFDRNAAVIAMYNHGEMCMYYDVKRNMPKIQSSELVERLFEASLNSSYPEIAPYTGTPRFVDNYDINQEKIIRRVLAGESLIVDGPPGTGKTLTIINMIATLLNDNKKVLVVSEKLAALSEVYNKMPQELRDFLMLLNSEDERDAVNLQVKEIKQAFAKFITTCKGEPKLAEVVKEDIRSAYAKTASAMSAIRKYYEETFRDDSEEHKPVIGLSYYDALSTVLRNEDIKSIRFGDMAILTRLVTREQYIEMYDRVKEIGEAFMKLTKDETHRLVRCPWYPINGGALPENTEAALEANKKTIFVARTLLEKASSIFEELGVDKSTLTLEAVEGLFNCAPTVESILAYSEATEEQLEALGKVLDRAVILDAEALGDFNIDNSLDFNEVNEIIPRLRVDKSLTVEELVTLYNNRDFISGMSELEEYTSRDIFNSIKVLYQEAGEHRNEYLRVFDKDKLDEAANEAIIKANSSLAEFYGTDDEKPGMLKFGAKSAYNKLRAYSFLEDVTFREIVDATEEFYKEKQCITQINDKKRELNRIFRKSLTAEMLAAIEILLSRCDGNEMSTKDYVKVITKEYNDINRIIDILNLPVDTRLKSMFTVVKACDNIKDLVDAIEPIAKRKLDMTYSQSCHKRLVALANEIIVINDFLSLSEFDGMEVQEIAEKLVAVYKRGKELAVNIRTCLTEWAVFGEAYFHNYYSDRQKYLCFGDVDIYVNEAVDRDVIVSANKYIKVKSGDTTLLVSEFFEVFENAEDSAALRGGYSFADIFEHSIYDAATKVYALELTERDGRGAEIVAAYNTIAACEKTIFENNIKLIRNACIERINPDDKSFGFVWQEKDAHNNTRRIFKNHADAILKLKKCFLVSPSTISVLLGGNEAFEHFDVVITDEASQLLPTAMLPVLFRTKQIVFVGDEYQMPPMSRGFVTEGADYEVVDESGEVTFLPRNTSALYMAKMSNRFARERLSLHFRSQSEALISYSQGRYYPYMRTFPTFNPGIPGTGLVDVFVPQGYCDGGVNDSEAKMVFRIVSDHFKKYYDEGTGTLRESIGILANGISQVEKIQSYINGDRGLKDKISKAITNFGDTPEKLFFIKTVRNVQGQEMDHIVISLTYGRTKPGGDATSSFYDISREAYGEELFNVAVSRARRSTTMIHSVLASELRDKMNAGTRDNFVKIYLEICEKYGTKLQDAAGLSEKSGKERFSSKDQQNPTSFAKSIINYLKREMKIDDYRIIIDYGVTEGSINIPVAILAPDCSRVELGIYLENYVNFSDYTDWNVKYYNILSGRGWKLHRVFIHDWKSNNDNEKKRLGEMVKRFVTI